jgi:endonuclease YncB( thermonuclease family)
VVPGRHGTHRFSGVVVSVLDGDTVDVLVDRTSVRVRLAEINAPEEAQAFGTKSRQTGSAHIVCS